MIKITLPKGITSLKAVIFTRDYVSVINAPTSTMSPVNLTVGLGNVIGSRAFATSTFPMELES